MKKLNKLLKKSSNETTPGKDGIPNEIYKLHPKLWSQILIKVFYDSTFNKKRIYDSQNMAAITLIHKKKEKHLPQNYRPIALINNDLKIYTKILAYRIQKIIKNIISEDQTGFIQGRSIVNHNLIIESTKYYYKNNPQQHLLTFLDFEKAYDRVEHYYLLDVLKKFNFGPKIITMIETLYKNQRSQLIINGFLSKPIYNFRGVRQGDPLSPLLFIIALEPLAINLNYKGEYGIKIPKSEKTQTNLMFADDTTLFSSSLENLDKQINIISTYSQLSGAKLNAHKSVILKLSNNNITTQNYKNLEKMKIIDTIETHKVLGIHQNMSITKEEQINAIFETFKNRITIYSNQARTIKGRLIILQTIIISTLYYIGQNLSFDKSIINKIYEYSINYIKNKINPDSTISQNKMNQISKSWIIQNKQNGGLNLINIEKIFQKFEQKKIINMINIIFNKKKSKVYEWIKLNWDIHKYFKASNIIWWNKNYKQIENQIKESIINPDFSTILNQLEKLKQNTTIITKNLQIKNEIIRKCPIWNQEINNRSIFTTFYRQTVRKKIENLIKTNMINIEDFIDNNNKPTKKWEQYKHNNNNLQISWKTWQTITFKIIQLKNKIETNIHINENITTKITIGTIQEKNKETTILNIEKVIETNKKIYEIIQKNTKQKNIKTQPIIQPKQNSITWNKEKEMKRFISPIVSNLLDRIQWKNLVLNYRITWINDENIKNCTFNCQEIETYKHLFFECKKIKPIWNEYQQIINTINSGNLQWYDIIFHDNIKIQLQYQEIKDELEQLIYIVKSIILNEIWLVRNKIKFQHLKYNTTQEQNNTLVQLNYNIKHHIKLHIFQWKLTKTKIQKKKIFDYLQSNEQIRDLLLLEKIHPNEK